jgi:hypothetical protein
MDEVERWVSRGRQLVDGVAGARPGSRPTGRGKERRSGARPTLDSLGRWVENRIDWLLEDGDDWREPWEEQEPVERAAPPAGRPRRRLEAVSRRGRQAAESKDPPLASASQLVGPAPTEKDGSEAWPDDSAFSVPRWQREEPPLSRERPAEPPPPSGGRPLPRSTRRR